MQCKDNQFMWDGSIYISYIKAIPSHIVAKDKFLDLASFRAAQTTEICSQHPGTFSIQPFCTDLFIKNYLLNVFLGT